MTCCPSPKYEPVAIADRVRVQGEFLSWAERAISVDDHLAATFAVLWRCRGCGSRATKVYLRTSGWVSARGDHCYRLKLLVEATP